MNIKLELYYEIIENIVNINGELMFQGISHFIFRESEILCGILIYVQWKYKRNLELLYDKDICRINMDGKLIF